MAGKIQASREHTDTGEHVRLLDDGYPCQTFRGAASHATTLNNSERDTDVGTARQEVYATSPVRWLVLIASATLNFSSAMNWVAFVAIADHTETYYDVSTFAVNMLSTVFMIASLVTGLGWAWLLDTLGVGIGLWLGMLLNFLGALIRFFSTFHSSGAHGHFWLVISGQVVCALANPSGLYLPAKVADVWFPQERRAFANMISSMSNPIGVAIGMLVPPLIVKGDEDLKKSFELLLLVLTGIAGINAFSTFFICRNRPAVPPSPSADDTKTTKLPFRQGLAKLVRNRSFLFLGLMWSIGIGTFNVFITLMQQMLCPYGYSDKFTGLCGAAMCVTGLIGATITSIYVDRTKNFVSTLKFCYAGAMISILGYLMMSFQPHKEALVLTFLCLFGLFGYGLLPIMIELAVECAFPVNVGTCSAILWMCGQLMGVVLILGTQQSIFERELSSSQKLISKCSIKGPKDLTYSGLFTACLGTVISCVFILCFRTPYRRLHSERSSGSTDETIETHY